MLKMLMDPMGGIVMTNDGNAILREITVQHPAAKSMIEIARTQDEEVRKFLTGNNDYKSCWESPCWYVVRRRSNSRLIRARNYHCLDLTFYLQSDLLTYPSGC